MKLRWRGLIIVFGIALGLAALAGGGKPAVTEKDVLKYPQAHHVVTTADERSGKIIFFFRDDCPHCTMPFFYAKQHDDEYHDIVFANTRIGGNNDAVDKYKIREVPTFVYRGRHYKDLEKVLEAKR